MRAREGVGARHRPGGELGGGDEQPSGGLFACVGHRKCQAGPDTGRTEPRRRVSYG